MYEAALVCTKSMNVRGPCFYGQERSKAGIELVGDEDVARSLLAACKGSAELVLHIYDQILANSTIVASPNLRLRLLRSALAVLREWAASGAAQRAGPSASLGIPLLHGKVSVSTSDQTLGQGIRDKLISATNRLDEALNFHIITGLRLLSLEKLR